MTPANAKRLSDTLWEIPISYKQGMRVPARIYASETLLSAMDAGVFEQIANVATLPGIVGHALCMPDGHWGYGFPIGGVAAFDVQEGVISPGGIGFDVNCGMRLAVTNLTFEEVQPRLRELVAKLFKAVPAGVGGKGTLPVSTDEFRSMVELGARYWVDKGYGTQEDLDRTEEGGCFAGADARKISRRAVERGHEQVGTLGSGNHYLEIQVVKPQNVVDPEVAKQFGFGIPNQIAVMMHCGSRGFGHQIATDYLEIFLRSMKKFGYTSLDRELACAPFLSDEGQDYFAAMKCAVNMSFANRQVILQRTREVFSQVFHKDSEELGIRQVYDISHNTAKLEDSLVDGQSKELLVHRKGATRAFGPGMKGVPAAYRETGQPVIIGGSMETGSYLLVGADRAHEAYYSTAHGSGRALSRRQAKKRYDGREIQRQMESRGIIVHSASLASLAEEAGAAYKNIDDVVQTVADAGLSRPIVKLVPIGNIKG